MSTGQGVLLVLGGWLLVWLVPVFFGYKRVKPRRWDLLFALYFVREGHLPACDRRHDHDTAIMGDTKYTCDAGLGQWEKTK